MDHCIPAVRGPWIIIQSHAFRLILSRLARLRVRREDLQVYILLPILLVQKPWTNKIFFGTFYKIVISSSDVLHGTLVEPGILPGFSLSSTVLTSMTIAELPPRPSRTSSKVAVWIIVAVETIQQSRNLFLYGHGGGAFTYKVCFIVISVGTPSPSHSHIYMLPLWKGSPFSADVIHAP